jgi:hypothetical protein
MIAATRTTETISFKDVKCVLTHRTFLQIIDIVKAGLAGLHDRLIFNTTLKTDRMNAISEHL